MFAEFDGYHVVLTTSDGTRDTNTIKLEPEVIAALEDYAKDVMELKKRDGV